jgi:hypothetical protein
VHGKNITQARASNASSDEINRKRIAVQQESQEWKRDKLFHTIPKTEKEVQKQWMIKKNES